MTDTELQIIDEELKPFKVNDVLFSNGEFDYMCSKGVMRKTVHLGKPHYAVLFSVSNDNYIFKYPEMSARLQEYKDWKHKQYERNEAASFGVKRKEETTVQEPVQKVHVETDW